MQPDKVDTFVLSSMDSEFMGDMCRPDFNIAIIFEAIARQVVGLALLVVLVIRGHNIDLLPQFD